MKISFDRKTIHDVPSRMSLLDFLIQHYAAKGLIFDKWSVRPNFTSAFRYPASDGSYIEYMVTDPKPDSYGHPTYHFFEMWIGSNLRPLDLVQSYSLLNGSKLPSYKQSAAIYLQLP